MLRPSFASHLAFGLKQQIGMNAKRVHSGSQHHFEIEVSNEIFEKALRSTPY